MRSIDNIPSYTKYITTIVQNKIKTIWKKNMILSYGFDNYSSAIGNMVFQIYICEFSNIL